MKLILQAIKALLRGLEKRIDRAIPAPETAKVGQMIVIKSVDENGKPTEWEAVDMPEVPEIPDNYLKYQIVEEVPAEQEDGVLYIVQTD